MGSKRLFNIGFTSLWLLLFYNKKLKAIRSDSGALRLLLDTFWNGPRLWPVKIIYPHKQHCYVAKLQQSFLSDEFGRSVLSLVENGRVVHQQRSDNSAEIAEKGMGRCLHSGNLFFFSPSDNAPIETIGNRSYAILESLSDDDAVNQRLLLINSNREKYRNKIMFGFDKIRAYLGDRLTFKKISTQSAAELFIENVVLDLDSWGLDKWQIAELETRFDENSHLEIRFKGLSRHNDERRWTISIRFTITAKSSIEIVSTQISNIDGAVFYFESVDSNQPDSSCLLCFKQLDWWRTILTSSFDFTMVTFERWLEAFIREVLTGATGFELDISDSDKLDIVRAFTGSDSNLTLKLEHKRLEIEHSGTNAEIDESLVMGHAR